MIIGNMLGSGSMERVAGFFRNLLFSGKRIRTSIKMLFAVLAAYFLLVLILLFQLLSRI